MEAFEVLPDSFYLPSARLVAPRLLGHWLIRITPDGPCGGPIVETEAYLRNDPACHAAAGQTRRNASMFGCPGHAYVYFIYGCHFCVNVVCQPAGIGEAVLIRAIEPAFGLPQMQRRRAVHTVRALTNGPAKLCQALQIDRELDGVFLGEAEGPLCVARNPDWRKLRKERGPLKITARIGLTRAADKPLRFLLTRSAFVSR